MMAYVRFSGLPAANAERMHALFAYVKAAKAEERMDAGKIADILGEIVEAHFWHPTAAELRDWQTRWESTPVEQRVTDPTLATPWDFESWVDAIENAEISYLHLQIQRDGTGVIEFEQLAMPSGGLEATEEMAKMFGATVTDKDYL
jgi:hypothetical protein